MCLVLERFQDPHTKIVKRGGSNYILPIFLGIVSESIVVTEENIKYPSIKKGFILKEINGLKIDDILTSFSKFNSLALCLMKILELISSSEDFNKITLTFIKDARTNQVIETIEYIKINRLKLDLVDYKKNYNIIKKEIENRYDISYYHCPTLMDENQTNELISNLKNDEIKGHVLFDIRNNMGGKVDLAIQLTSLFINKKSKIFLKSRFKVEEISIFPQKSSLNGKKIGILFNNLTSSSLEFIFLKSLLNQKNIKFMGTPTSGMLDIATIYNIDNKYRLSLTTKKYVDIDQKELELKRINPDIYIDININDIKNNMDSQLNEGIFLLKRGDIQLKESY